MSAEVRIPVAGVLSIIAVLIRFGDEAHPDADLIMNRGPVIVATEPMHLER